MEKLYDHGYKNFFGLEVVGTRYFMVNLKEGKLEKFYIKIQE